MTRVIWIGVIGRLWLPSNTKRSSLLGRFLKRNGKTLPYQFVQLLYFLTMEFQAQLDLIDGKIGHLLILTR
ncbi:MAG: hypothetical protein EBR82_54865 [Caulobacteraceae bacterium]|nr:hypothetical protein [Caulobacteraceae bacterium]